MTTGTTNSIKDVILRTKSDYILCFKTAVDDDSMKFIKQNGYPLEVIFNGMGWKINVKAVRDKK